MSSGLNHDAPGSEGSHRDRPSPARSRASSASTSNTTSSWEYDRSAPDSDYIASSYGHSNYSDDSDYDYDAKFYEWPWNLQKSYRIEHEIRFYQRDVARHEKNGSGELELMQVELLLGNAYLACGKYTDAEAPLLKVRGSMERTWGWNHVATMDCTNSLAQVFENLEKYDQVHELYEAAIKGVRRTLGREYPWTLQLSNNWACFCVRRSDFEKAKELFNDVYKATRHVLGRNHPAKLSTLCNLLGRFEPSRENDWSESHMKIAVDHLREDYGTENKNFKNAARHLVFLHLKAGYSENVKRLCDELHMQVPDEGSRCSLHEDINVLIPNLKSARREPKDHTLPVKFPEDRLRKVGFKLTLSVLEWTRSFIKKWTGMDFKAFTEQPAIGTWIHFFNWGSFDWGSFVNPATLLEAACAAGHEPAVRMLLQKYKKSDDFNGELNLDMQKAFRKGVLSGSEPVVRLLLEFDLDVNTPDDSTKTALHDAAELGHDVVASLLLDVGANKHQLDGDGCTPMDLAMKQSHEAVVRLFMGRNGAILTSSTATLRSPSGVKQKRDKKRRITGFNATVVHFYVENPAKDGGGDSEAILNDAHRVQHVPVERLVWNDGNVLREVFTNRARGEIYPKADFRWIHLPANCMSWVEALMTTFRSIWDDDEPCPDMDLLREELWMRQLHDPVHSSVHGRFMKPLCREIPGFPAGSGNLVAFMPYLHWESDVKRKEMNQVIQAAVSADQIDWAELTRILREKSPFTTKPGTGTESSYNLALLVYHLFPEPPRSPVHIRRTLDQFQHYMTENTEDRDTDQVISRYFQRRHPDFPLPIMMVDQLWIWILNRTVVTSFPQRWESSKGQPRENGLLDTANVLDSILDRLKQKDRSPVRSTFDLAELIMARCLGLNCDKIEWGYERFRFLEIFDHSINYVANEEIRCFNDFVNRASKGDKDKGDGDNTIEEKMKQIMQKKQAKKTKKTQQKKQKKDQKKQNQQSRVENSPNETVKKQARGLIERGAIKRLVGSFGKKSRPDGEKAVNPTALGAEIGSGAVSVVAEEDMEIADDASPERTGEGRSTGSLNSKNGTNESKERHKEGKRQRKKRNDVLDRFVELLSSKTSPTQTPQEEESFDISREVELLREIKDIRDELNILGNLFDQQNVVLDPFMHVIEAARKGVTVTTRDAAETATSKPSLLDAVQRQKTHVKRMDESAKRLYDHLGDLLDLKQKQANVFEARTMRASGNTITVFTIVTIIFLPASFMAAFLALPISEYPSVDNDKMELGYAIKYTVVATIAVAIPFIVFALYVNPILQLVKIVLRPFRTATRFAYGAAPYLHFAILVTLKASWSVIKNFANLGKLLWLCVRWFLPLLLDWRRIYNRARDFRENKKKAKEDGREWRNRHYVTGYFFEKVGASRKRRCGRPAVAACST